MDVKIAKAIFIDEWLAHLGVIHVKEHAGRKWYKSPFRDERTASFVLSKDGRAWFDHGEGVGGNILDLAMRLGNCHTLPDALAFLDQTAGFLPGINSGTNTRPKEPTLTKPQTPAYQLLEATPFRVASPTGEWYQAATYLQNRAINPTDITSFAYHVVFHPINQPHIKRFGFGLPNQSGGYELRSRVGQTYVKTCVGPKDISFFGATKPGSSSIHIFEGAPDFYTYLTNYSHLDTASQNFLILNGTAMVPKAIAFLQRHPFKLYLFWNHQDEAGTKTVTQFRAAIPQLGTMSHLYEGYKDYNDWQLAQATNKPVDSSAPLEQPSKLKTTPKLNLGPTK